MPIERAAPEIDPVVRIASNSAILPGPMRPPDGKSMRMDRCVPAMVEPSRTCADEVARIVRFRQGPRGARAANVHRRTWPALPLLKQRCRGFQRDPDAPG